LLACLVGVQEEVDTSRHPRLLLPDAYTLGFRVTLNPNPYRFQRRKIFWRLYSIRVPNLHPPPFGLASFQGASVASIKRP